MQLSSLDAMQHMVFASGEACDDVVGHACVVASFMPHVMSQSCSSHVPVVVYACTSSDLIACHIHYKFVQCNSN